MVVALVGCQGQPHPAANSGPGTTIDRFTAFYFQGYGSGLPTKAERDALSPMVTAEFAAALDGAAQAERCEYERHKGTEPPLLQGDLFSSLFEKANGILGVTESARDATNAEYALQFEYRLPGAATAAATWTDSVRLRLSGGQWFIDDFVRRGDWDFATKGSVREMLQNIAKLCVQPPLRTVAP